MPLNAGTRLGVYEIVAAIGAGGMGEVYRARDTKLGRDVALKILPASFASDPDRLMRFEREARTLASLNHPNIAHIHGLEDSGEVRALVMELVEGDDLSARIARGAIPREEAVPIASQVAAALEAAHEAGIIHRDLKPANIKVRDDGTVKVLDFGLAKALDAAPTAPVGKPADPGPWTLDPGPTMTSPALTALGLILGTAAYMSPEQAKGRPVDRRADIWAFGVVLYEMLTGERCFKGEDISDTLASVLKDRPALDALPPGIPPRLRRLLERCLERDPKQRLRDIGEARIALQDLSAADADAPTLGSVGAPPAMRRRLAPWLMAAVLAGVALGWTAFAFLGTPRAAAGASAIMRVSVPPFPGLAVVRNPVAAPDDRFIVYEGVAGGVSMLYLHDFESGQVRALPGTENGSAPFVSPDGRWIGFLRGTELVKVRVAGGDAVKICDVAGNFPGAAWTSEGRIIFPIGWLNGLSSVSADGGEPASLTTVQTDAGEKGHWWPRPLPDGRHVLFTIWNAGGGLIDSDVAVLDLQTGEYRKLVRGADAWFLPTGHLVYYHAGSYQAVAFDPTTQRVTGESVPVLEDATDPMPQGTNWLGVAISERGTLFYLRDQILPEARFAMVAPGTDPKPLPFPARSVFNFALSPDGRHLAASSLEAGVIRMHLLDLQSGIDERLNLSGSNWFPYWKHDGSGFAFTSMRKGDFDIYFKAIGGSATDVPIRATPTDEWPLGWTLDDTGFLFTETLADGSISLKVRPSNGTGDESTIASRVDTNGLSMSPDGRWMAYDDSRDGDVNIYVRPYPGPGTEVRVSPGGGQQAAWSPDGRELYYVSKDSIIAVPFTVTASRFQPGAGQVLFTSPLLAQRDIQSPLAVRGPRTFIVALLEREPEPSNVHVVLNWSRDVAAKLAGR